MDDTLTMRSAIARANTSTRTAARRGAHGVPFKLGRQALAVDILKFEERQAVDFAGMVNLNNVRMVQTGDGFGFTDEAEERLGIRVGTREDHFERTDAVEPNLAGLVDNAHSSAPELAFDLVTRYHWRGRPAPHR